MMWYLLLRRLGLVSNAFELQDRYIITELLQDLREVPESVTPTRDDLRIMVDHYESKLQR